MTGDSAQTPYTPAVSLMVAQNAAIDLIRQEGLENVFERHRGWARPARPACRRSASSCSARTTPRRTASPPCKVPAGVDGGKITKVARDKYGVWLAGGQGKLKGQIFRFGHCGYFGASDILVGLGVLEMVLAELGYDVKWGAGTGRRGAGARAEPRPAVRG